MSQGQKQFYKASKKDGAACKDLPVKGKEYRYVYLLKIKIKSYWSIVYKYFIKNKKKFAVAVPVLGSIASLITIWIFLNPILEKQKTIIYLENIRSMKTSFSSPHSITQQPIVFKWKSGKASFSLYKESKPIIEELRHSSPFKLEILEPDIYKLKTNLQGEILNLCFEIVKDP